MRIVLDTNVLVAGLLSPHGPCGRIVDALLAGDLVPLVDDRILAEYAEVLRRPEFGFATEDVDDLLEHLGAEGEQVVAPPLALVLPDATDAPFLEVALAGSAEAVITGNLKHFSEAARGGLAVLGPAPFLDGFLARKA